MVRRELTARERNMLPEYKKKTYIGMALYIILPFIFVFIVYAVGGTTQTEETKSILVIPVFLLMYGCFIYGCCCYAKGKGYHGAWGILGILSVLGLFILVCFPDKHKSIKESQKMSKNNK